MRFSLFIFKAFLTNIMRVFKMAIFKHINYTFMKIIGTLISLACLFTLGGVYATFNYANMTAAPVSETLAKQISAYIEHSPRGVITFESDLTIRVVDGGGYIPTDFISGSSTIAFTPHKYALPENVRTEGIKLNIRFDFIGNLYNGENIFLLNTPSGLNYFSLNSGDPIIGQYDLTSITTYDLAEFFYINYSIHLPTQADFDVYKEAFLNTEIKITVYEAT